MGELYRSLAFGLQLECILQVNLIQTAPPRLQYPVVLKTRSPTAGTSSRNMTWTRI